MKVEKRYRENSTIGTGPSLSIGRGSGKRKRLCLLIVKRQHQRLYRVKKLVLLTLIKNGKKLVLLTLIKNGKKAYSMALCMQEICQNRLV